jgi:predicted permease
VLRQLRAFLSRPRDHEIARELRDHLDLEAEELARSTSPHDASDRARRRFGNPTFIAETVRDLWRFAWLDQLGQDLRQAFRGLRRSPVYAVSATLTLSLGIGAIVAVFGMADPIIDRPYPLLPENALVYISQPSKSCPACVEVSPAAFSALRERSRSLTSVSATASWRTSLRDADGSEIVDGYLTSANLFSAISAPFALGGGFPGDADRPGHPHVAVLSYAFWRQRFHGSRAVLDSTVTLGGDPYTVVGVLAPHLIFPTDAAVYAPLVLSSDELSSHSARYLAVFGRLRSGATLDAAAADARLVAGQLALESPRTDSLSRLEVQPLRAFHTSDVKILLLVFSIAATLVLFAACVSLANLGFARLTARRREIAVRAALGGRGLRIARHLLAEAVLVATGAAVIGIGLAAAGAHAMRLSIPASFARYSPGWSKIGIDGRAVLFAVLVCLVSTLLFALLPALRATRVRLSSVLSEDARGSVGTQSARLRSALVIVQVSVALALLSCATLLTRSVHGMLGGDPGVRLDHVLSMHLSLPHSMTDSAVRDFVDRLDSRLRATPGVRDAGLTSTTPLSNNWWGTVFEIPGRAPSPDGRELTANDQRVTPDYFRTMGIHILSGRGIEPRDGVDGQRVAVINHFMHEQLYPGEDPIGRVLSIGAQRWTIVGVASDVRHGGFDEPMRYEIYRPVQQALQRDGDLEVWTAGDADSMREAVRRAVAATDPAAAIGDLMTMREIQARHLSPFELLAGVLIAFATVTSVIAVVALYGIIAYGVAQRRREIGVRIALGAQRSAIARQIAASAVRLTGIGLAIGAIGAIAFAQVLKSVLYSVAPTDPITPLAAAGVLLAVALAAALPPAFSAATLDPVIALKD